MAWQAPQTPDARQFFRPLWGDARLVTPSLADLSPHALTPPRASAAGTPLGGGGGGAASPEQSGFSVPPPPRWTRVSSSSARAGAAAETPSPRRTSLPGADAPEITPAKQELAGLPRLMRASMGPRATAPAADLSSPAAAGKRPLSAPLPTWATEPAAEAEAEAASPGTSDVESPAPSPRRRLRAKTPTDSPASQALVAASPPPFQLNSGPASSFGNLLERTHLSPPSGMTPRLKKPRTARWQAEDRGTAFLDIPIAALAKADLQRTKELDSDEDAPRRYPRRIRMAPLEFWRNERVITERLPGSATPSICRVELNCAPRPGNLAERKIAAEVVQQATPVITDGQELEFVSVKTDSLVSKLVVLPPFTGRTNPPTFTLPPFTTGHVFVLEGALRYAHEGEDDQAVLGAGDHLWLPAVDCATLLASAGAGVNSPGAKFKVFLFANDGFAANANEDRLPLGH